MGSEIKNKVGRPKKKKTQSDYYKKHYKKHRKSVIEKKLDYYYLNRETLNPVGKPKKLNIDLDFTIDNFKTIITEIKDIRPSSTGTEVILDFYYITKPIRDDIKLIYNKTLFKRHLITKAIITNLKSRDLAQEIAWDLQNNLNDNLDNIQNSKAYIILKQLLENKIIIKKDIIS